MTGRNGGGVACYLANTLQAKILQQSDSEYCKKPEYFIAEISLRGCSELFLAIVYRPPHCGHLAEFFNIFIELPASCKHSIILADFNADLSLITYDSEQIASFVESSNFYLVPYRPTHHSRNSFSTLDSLDFCIIDDENKLVSFSQHDMCFLSNHDLNNIKYKVKVERLLKRTINVRDFRSFNIDSFRNELSSYD